MNKTIFISGSSRGIGKATAEKAAAEGYTVIVHGRENSDELRAVATSLGARSVYFDVANQDEVNKVMPELIKEVGGIDVLVNNAGIIKPGTILDSNYDDWVDQFKVNVMGMVNLVKAIAPSMLAAGGSIVNVASARGHSNMAAKRIAAYSATKAAVINLTVTMAQELAPKIRVNAVSPSFTETDFAKNWTEAVREQTRNNLLQRPARPEEVADAILFLASDKASHITGQTLQVDGGYSVSNK